MMGPCTVGWTASLALLFFRAVNSPRAEAWKNTFGTVGLAPQERTSLGSGGGGRIPGPAQQEPRASTAPPTGRRGAQRLAHRKPPGRDSPAHEEEGRPGPPHPAQPEPLPRDCPAYSEEERPRPRPPGGVVSGARESAGGGGSVRTASLQVGSGRSRVSAPPGRVGLQMLAGAAGAGSRRGRGRRPVRPRPQSPPGPGPARLPPGPTPRPSPLAPLPGGRSPG